MAAQPEFILAEAEFKAGNNTAAINDFGQAIQLDPGFLASYLDRGNAEVRLGQFDDAIVDFSRIVKADPNNAIAYSNRGAAYGQLGENNLALADLRRASAQSPKDAMTEYNLASAEGQSGDLKGALADMNKSVANGPSVYTYRGRAVIESALGNQKSAIKDISVAMKLNVANPALLADRAMFYQRSHLYPAALADYGAAIKLAPMVAQYRLLRAQTDLFAKDVTGAISDLRAARQTLSGAGDDVAVANIDRAIKVLTAKAHAASSPAPAPKATPQG